MLSFVLALRALRWRAAASATVFAVALIGITAGAVGPIYLHTVDQTVLSQRLVDAPQSRRDLRIERETTIGPTQVNWSAAIRRLAGQASDKRWFDPPVYSANAPVTWKGHVTYGTELATLDHLCSNVHVVSGRCLSDNAMDEAVITERTARGQQLKVGDVLRPEANDTPAELAVRIVGIVTPRRPDGSFWTPWPYLNAGDSVFGTDLPKLDAFFVGPRFLARHDHDVGEIIGADLRLRAADIRTADIAPLRARLRAVQNAAGHVGSVSTVSIPSVGSGLPSVLDAMQSEMARARTLVVLATAQLVALAIAVLYAVVAGTTAATANEVALAKLRGRSTRTVLAQGLGQPVLLVLLAAPVAAVSAWLVVRTLAGRLVGSSAAVAFPTSALVVVLVVTAASLVAAAVAARRIFRSPIGQLLRRGTDAAASPVGLLLADVGDAGPRRRRGSGDRLHRDGRRAAHHQPAVRGRRDHAGRRDRRARGAGAARGRARGGARDTRLAEGDVVPGRAPDRAPSGRCPGHRARRHRPVARDLLGGRLVGCGHEPRCARAGPGRRARGAVRAPAHPDDRPARRCRRRRSRRAHDGRRDRPGRERHAAARGGHRAVRRRRRVERAELRSRAADRAHLAAQRRRTVHPGARSGAAAVGAGPDAARARRHDGPRGAHRRRSHR